MDGGVEESWKFKTPFPLLMVLENVFESIASGRKKKVVIAILPWAFKNRSSCQQVQDLSTLIGEVTCEDDRGLGLCRGSAPNGSIILFAMFRRAKRGRQKNASQSDRQYLAAFPMPKCLNNAPSDTVITAPCGWWRSQLAHGNPPEAKLLEKTRPMAVGCQGSSKRCNLRTRDLHSF